jgi:hypothetical protein
MVKTLILILMVRVCVLGSSPDLTEIRTLFQHAASDEHSCKELLRLVEPFEQSDPLLAGYEGAGMMVMAKHLFNPFSKLIWYNRGKAVLEGAIKADGQSAELRFLRYSIQCHSPFFLGYHDKIVSDKACLVTFLRSSGDPSLKVMIMAYLR